MEEADICSRLKQWNFKYIDSLENYELKVKPEDREKVIQGYEEIIAILISGLAKIHSQKDDMIRQLNRFKQYAETYPDDGERVMTFLKGYNEFYENYSRVLLIRVDVMTAYKYLLLAETDWDYRFFARRIYTLAYECGLYIKEQLKPNKEFNDLRLFGDRNMFKALNEKRDELSSFLESNENQFKEVRNAGEAHKDRDVERQFRAIESLSVKESRTIISEFSKKLMDYYGALVDFHKSLEEYNNHLITIQGPAPIGIGGNVKIKSICGSPTGIVLNLEVD